MLAFKVSQLLGLNLTFQIEDFKSTSKINFLMLHTCGDMVYWLSLLHNFIQQSLNSGSAQVQILLVVCQRFAVVRISNSGPGWK